MKKHTTICKFSISTILAIILCVCFIVPVYAIDLEAPLRNLANNELIPQIKAVVGVVLGVASVLLVALLIFKLVTLYTAYRRGEEFHILPIVLIVVGIIVAGTGTAWMWGIIGG